MKIFAKFLLTSLLLASVMLFSKCKNDVQPSDTQMPYDETKAKEHFISVDTAAKFTALFKQGLTALGRQLPDSSYLRKNFNIPRAELFNRDAMVALLNQQGAKGVRVYLGKDDAGFVRMILVAVDSVGNDITGSNGKVLKDTAGTSRGAVILEAGQRCPIICPDGGPLN